MKNFNFNLIGKYGFSFVELVVSITISMILMFSVSIFVQNGIKNITSQNTIFGNYLQIKQFTNDVYESFSYIDNSFLPVNLNSGVLVKIFKDFDKGGFLYVGQGNFDKLYCQSGSDSEITNHVYLKNFVPFEGFSGDLFAGSSFDNGLIKTNMFAGSINNATGILVGPTDVAFGNGNITYVSDTLNHSVYRFDKTNISSTMTMVVGKGMFGDEFYDGLNGTGVFLNSPTGLSYSTIGGTGYLFISDTLNDRIIYMDLSDNKVYKLLGRDDGIKEPTGIYYDDSLKTLYIANSGKKQILAYSSSGSFKDNINLSFSEDVFVTNVDNVKFTFMYGSGLSNPNLFSPTQTGSVSFSPNVAGQDFLERQNNNLIYYFVDYTGLEVSDGNCVVSGAYVIGTSGIPVYCSGVGTGVLSVPKKKTFFGNYQVGISSIGPVANFTNNGTYYLKLSLNSGSVEKSFHYFPYFVSSDNNIFTKDDNIMTVLTGGLGYPTGIYPNGNNLIFNDFLTRKSYEIDKNGSSISSKNLNYFNFSISTDNKNIDNIFYSPIKDYYIKYNSANKVLNFYFNYYKNYSCYSQNNSSAVSEFVMKKSYK
ncbi:MAG: hypothetical protein PHN31_04125 [Candidatus Gracilibacteria bacterium]|nr:hypothetical protein [Candidatus Gracilibacteria bacterium]